MSRSSSPVSRSNPVAFCGWMLIRFSGTEPIIRVYTETTKPSAVDAILADGLKTAGIE